MKKEINKEQFLNKIKKKNKSSSNIIAIVISVTLLIAAIAGAAVFWFSSSDITIDDGSQNNPFTEKNNPSDTQVSSNPEKNEVETPEIIRNENSYNILFIGKDRVGSNTDVILLINFNADLQTVNVMQIPRDTYVDSEHNTSDRSKRVNAIYAYGSLDTGSVEGGLQALEKAIEDCFAITIDSYFMVNLSGFRNIVDAIGGVWVDVPFDMFYVDEAQDLYIDLKEGPTLLDGDKAEQFVRFRNDYAEGDLGRVQAQKIFLTALVEKFLSPEWYSVDKLTNVANYILECSTTNMKASDIAGYLKKIDFSRLSAESIVFYTAPGESYQRSNGAWYYSLYLNENREVINKAFNVYNVEVEEKHMALCEESHKYNNADVNGETASELSEKPPHIYLDPNKISGNHINTDESVETGVVTDVPFIEDESAIDDESSSPENSEENVEGLENNDVEENVNESENTEDITESNEEVADEFANNTEEESESIDDNTTIETDNLNDEDNSLEESATENETANNETANNETENMNNE